MEDRRYRHIWTGDGREVFFHTAGLQDIEIMDLKRGDIVGFDVKRGPCGSKAVNIKRT